MTQRTRVSFELERLALEGDELIVSGFWTGVRGMRFVRPTLLFDDRRILATLEHKPWAPAENARWTAAFPWTGGVAVDADNLAIAVAPKVIVPLGETGSGAPVPAEPAPAPDSARARQPIAAETVQAPVAEAAPAAAEKPATTPRPAPAAKPAATLAAVATAAAQPAADAKPAPVAKAAPAAAPVATPAPPPAPIAAPAPPPAPIAAPTPPPVPVALPTPVVNGVPAPPPPVIPVDPRSDELARALAAAERERDRALAQLAEAVEARKAAVRTRARMELDHDAAIEAREEAESALARAKAERQEAIVKRDEVLIAFRTLQRQLKAERAQADRQTRGEPDEDAETDEALGVRTVPAVRPVMAELQYPRREQKLRLTMFDMWVVRLLGLAAAGCFFLLLFSILRVLI